MKKVFTQTNIIFTIALLIGIPAGLVIKHLFHGVGIYLCKLIGM